MDGSGYSGVSEEVQVKKEPGCVNSAESWDVSEAAARAGLYAEHAIKGDLVLGPELLQQPDVLFMGFERTHADSDNSHRGSGHWDHTSTKRECPLIEVHVTVECVKEEPEWEVPGRGGEQPVLRDCSVRLERIPALEALLGSSTCRGTPEWQSSHTRYFGNQTNTEKEFESYLQLSTSEEETYLCPICHKRFALKSNLLEHVVVHIHTPTIPERDGSWPGADGASPACGHQPRPPPAPAPLPRGARAGGAPRHADKLHSCKICKQHFKRLSNLTKHTRIHTCEKPFSCEICTKQFTESSSLKIHRRIYTGVRPFSCEICTKQFRRLWDLNNHRRIHTGDKPYACDMCGKRFSVKSNLVKHKRRHEK